ncbi:Uncharacterised protein [Raoultella terrigena]|uniref:Uncharacterized protein n=1 Tax=Raoultella terrigena TaxID=577 RepID=A0A3P8M3K3_RAOTE|nr:Uncharacterised protein [Raoultella terrigena]
MDDYPAIAPMLNAGNAVCGYLARRKNAPQIVTARCKSAAVRPRLSTGRTRNDWSKVILRVMLDAAQDAGVVFEPNSRYE